MIQTQTLVSSPNCNIGFCKCCNQVQFQYVSSLFSLETSYFMKFVDEVASSIEEILEYEYMDDLPISIPVFHHSRILVMPSDLMNFKRHLLQASQLLELNNIIKDCLGTSEL